MGTYAMPVMPAKMYAAPFIIRVIAMKEYRTVNPNIGSVITATERATVSTPTPTYRALAQDGIRLSVTPFAIPEAPRTKALVFNIPQLMVRRNDTMVIQQRILAMTPDERKRLGISKSGLWYQRKKIAQGKTFEVMTKYFPS
jgi:hypothetical protein